MLSKKQILIVEESNIMRDTMQDIFELDGYYVVTAKNGKEGYTLQNNNTFDLIIINLNTSDGDEIQLIQELQQNPDTIMLITLDDGIYSRQEFQSIEKTLGKNSVIQKPFNNEEIMNKAKYLIESN
jgi:DNA-binding response OmpR family regulator